MFKSLVVIITVCIYTFAPLSASAVAGTQEQKLVKEIYDMAVTGKVICSNLYGVGDSIVHLRTAYKGSVKVVGHDGKIVSKNLPVVWYYHVDSSIYKVEYKKDTVISKGEFSNHSVTLKSLRAYCESLSHNQVDADVTLQQLYCLKRKQVYRVDLGKYILLFQLDGMKDSSKVVSYCVCSKGKEEPFFAMLGI